MYEDHTSDGINGEQHKAALFPLSSLERERHDLALATFQAMRKLKSQNSAGITC